jgi:hypothetical protein
MVKHSRNGKPLSMKLFTAEQFEQTTAQESTVHTGRRPDVIQVTTIPLILAAYKF